MTDDGKTAPGIKPPILARAVVRGSLLMLLLLAGVFVAIGAPSSFWSPVSSGDFFRCFLVAGEVALIGIGFLCLMIVFHKRIRACQREGHRTTQANIQRV